MTSSKIISMALAAFSSLALEFQAVAASAQSAIWHPDQSLYPGFALRSGNWHTLLLQFDGNLVLYNPSGVAIWSTQTAGWGTPRVALMAGTVIKIFYTNDSIYTSQGLPNCVATCPAYLAVQDDGNLVMYAPGGVPAWSSGTWGQ